MLCAFSISHRHENGCFREAFRGPRARLTPSLQGAASRHPFLNYLAYALHTGPFVPAFCLERNRISRFQLDRPGGVDQLATPDAKFV